VTHDMPPAVVRVNEQRQPPCPKCGATMIVRIAKRGEHKGNKFYACPNYPECRSFIPIKEGLTTD
jgi:ssDNA-binding Zn-finger/Zn-ribbon topoisomerase 1